MIGDEWKIEKIIRSVNQVLVSLKVEKHPDKTFIGRTLRGFDFLGYCLKPEKMASDEETINGS